MPCCVLAERASVPGSLAPRQAIRGFVVNGGELLSPIPRVKKLGGADESYFGITWFDSRRLHQSFVLPVVKIRVTSMDSWVAGSNPAGA